MGWSEFDLWEKTPTKIKYSFCDLLCDVFTESCCSGCRCCWCWRHRWCRVCAERWRRAQLLVAIEGKSQRQGIIVGGRRERETSGEEKSGRANGREIGRGGDGEGEGEGEAEREGVRRKWREWPDKNEWKWPGVGRVCVVPACVWWLELLLFFTDCASNVACKDY